MRVILLQDIPGAGKKWEVKEVKGGYGRNYLLARHLAIPATASALKDVKLKQKQEAEKKVVQEDLLLKSLKGLEGSLITIERKASEKGHLFDGVDIKEIGEIIKEKAKIEIPLEWIKLEKTIKETGKHKIAVQTGKREASFEIEIKESNA